MLRQHMPKTGLSGRSTIPDLPGLRQLAFLLLHAFSHIICRFCGMALLTALWPVALFVLRRALRGRSYLPALTRRLQIGEMMSLLLRRRAALFWGGIVCRTVLLALVYRTAVEAPD